MKEQDRALLQRRRRRRDHRQGRRLIYEVPLILHKEGLDEKITQILEHLDRSARISRELGEAWSTARANPSARSRSHGRQVRRPDRVVQEPERGALPRGLPPTGRGSTSSTSTPRSSTTPRMLSSRGWDPRAPRLRQPRRRGEGLGGAHTLGSSRIPYFGICYGMQLAVIEYARHVAGLEAANSREIDPEHPVRRDRPAARAARRWKRRGRPCGSAPGPAWCNPGTHAPTDAYGEGARSTSAIATATSSTRLSATELSEAGLVLSGTSPDGRPGGDRRGGGPPLVPGLPVPSGVRFDAVPAPPALRRLRRGGIAEAASRAESPRARSARCGVFGGRNGPRGR